MTRRILVPSLSHPSCRRLLLHPLLGRHLLRDRCARAARLATQGPVPWRRDKREGGMEVGEGRHIFEEKSQDELSYTERVAKRM